MTYHESPLITDWQKQIIFGTVLGGSSIIKQKKGRNCYLTMRGKDLKWLKCKAQELTVIAAPTPWYCSNDYYRWHSVSCPFLNEFYDLFYEGGKRKIEMELLDILRAVGLAIWFIDAGSLKDEHAIINVNKFGKDGADLISKYFSEIDFDNGVINKRGSLRIRLEKRSTKRFMLLIGDYIPNFMLKA